MGDDSEKNAAQPNKTSAAKKQPANKATLTKLSIGHQKTALSFAKEHHPELASLLETLKQKSAPEYNRGIRELHNSVERLERIKEKHPARLKSEIEAWKTDSQIRLLSARWMLSPSDKLKAQIDKLFRKRQTAKKKRLQAEEKRIKDRLKSISEQLGQSKSDLQAELDTNWQRLNRRAAAFKKSQEGKTKKTAPKKKDTTN